MASGSTVQVVAEPGPADTGGLRVEQAATVVIFGATGDLTGRKLVPALLRLFRQGLLPEQMTILGASRRELDDDAFRAMMREAVAAHVSPEAVEDEGWGRFAASIGYQQVRFREGSDYAALARRIEKIERARGVPGQRLFYLATDPSFFGPVARRLAEAGLASDASARVVMEKPFGHDLDGAIELTKSLAEVLGEEQIYRIDHYLGKETVQNILSFRFGNAVFEALFNSRYVDHVQITVAESIGMEGRRGQYYDQAGALRDIIQNHALQLLALVAMEPPATFEASAVRDEKVKVLRALRPVSADCDVVRGQYTAGVASGAKVHGYREEAGVAANSRTETYVALRTGVDNWRWAGVPFVLRTGKRMAARYTEIAIQFKQPPLTLFTTVECEGDVCDISAAKPNVLVFRIQPNEGISLAFSAKRPGMQFQIHSVEMDFSYDESFGQALPQAYERLLLDALRADPTLFMRSDEVEWSWRFVDPILRAWQDDASLPLRFYEPGSCGPVEAERLFTGCAGQWRQMEC